MFLHRGAEVYLYGSWNHCVVDISEELWLDLKSQQRHVWGSAKLLNGIEKFKYLLVTPILLDQRLGIPVIETSRRQRAGQRAANVAAAMLAIETNAIMLPQLTRSLVIQ